MTVDATNAPTTTVNETTTVERARADPLVTGFSVAPGTGLSALAVTVRSIGFDKAAQAAVDIDLSPGWACLPSCSPLFVASLPRGVEVTATVFVVPAGFGLFTLTAPAYHLPSSFTDDPNSSNDTAQLVVDPPAPSEPPPPPPPPPIDPVTPPPPPPSPVTSVPQRLKPATSRASSGFGPHRSARLAARPARLAHIGRR